MSFLGKVYKHQKDENFKAFLDTLGMPEERVQALLNSCPTHKMEKNGDEYVATTVDGDKTKKLKFKSGVEFDETISETTVAKTTFNIDGNIVKQVQKFPDGKSLMLERTYSDSELVVVLTSSFWDGVARRYYTAA